MKFVIFKNKILDIYIEELPESSKSIMGPWCNASDAQFFHIKLGLNIIAFAFIFVFFFPLRQFDFILFI